MDTGAGVWRAAITTMGFVATRLYDLTDDDLEDERVKAMIASNWLVPAGERLPANVHGQRVPPESGDPFEHETTHHVAPASFDVT